MSSLTPDSSVVTPVLPTSSPPDESTFMSKRMKRFLAASALAGGLAFLFRRDRVRRANGITRRSLTDLIARLLWGTNTGATRLLASFVASHPRITYAALAVIIVAGYSYSKVLRRWVRDVLHRPARTVDELAAYPTTEEDELRAQLGEVAKAQEEKEEVAATHERGLGGMNKATLYFLQHMSHITNSMDEAATQSLLSQLDTVKVPKGSVLFRKHSTANDGMYTVVSGTLGVYADDEADPTSGAGMGIGVPAGGFALRSAVPMTPTDEPVTPTESSLPSDGAAARRGHRRSRSAGMVKPRSTSTSRRERRGSLQDSLHKQSARKQLLYTFSVGQTVGENALLAGPEHRRVVTCEALTAVEVLRFDRRMFDAFLDHHPHSIISFILTTTARQWRVAYFTLVEYLKLPGARDAALGPAIPYIDLEDVAESATNVVTKTAGENVFWMHDESDSVFVLLEGTAEVVRADIDGEQSDTITPGAIIGGTAVFVQLPYSETVICTEPCRFAVFPRSRFVDFAKNGPTGGHDGEGSGNTAELVLLDIALAVAKCMTVLMRLFLEAGCMRTFLKAGDLLYKRGDTSDAMYIIISGRLRSLGLNPDTPASDDEGTAGADPLYPSRVTRNQGSLEMGRGDTVGELSALGSETTRDHTVAVVRDSELVRISAVAFDRMVRAHPALMRMFSERLAARLRQVTKSLYAYGSQRRSRAATANLVTLAVIPAGSNPPHLGGFARKLVKSLQIEGAVLHLTSARVDEAMGEGTTERLGSLFERSRVAAWISTQEEAHRFLVFEADAEPTLWSKTCIRQADCVLLVGRGSEKPDLSKVERQFMFHSSRSDPSSSSSFGVNSRTFTRKELILLHEPTCKPRHTRKWLRLRRVDFHHHVRIPITGDYERVVRHLCGKARGLVLGGGGARGIAHLGVLSTLEQNNLAPDYIGGTSQGAYMAACYATTLDMTECARVQSFIAKKIGSWTTLIQDFTFPVISYFSGEGFNEAIQDSFGDIQIEDMWLNYFCITTNVTKSSMGVHDAGCLWRYCRASMTVNGLLPPMVIDGDVVVDGGYVNNLPVDTMFEMYNPELVIAVDVENKDRQQFEMVENYGDTLSGWWVMWRKLLALLRVAKPVNIPPTHELSLDLSYISHTMMLNRLLREGKNDDSIMYVRPEVNAYGLLAYDKADELIKLGVEAATKRIKKWKKHCAIRRNSLSDMHRELTSARSMLDLHTRHSMDGGMDRSSSEANVRRKSSSYSLRGIRRDPAGRGDGSPLIIPEATEVVSGADEDGSGW